MGKKNKHRCIDTQISITETLCYKPRANSTLYRNYIPIKINKNHSGVQRTSLSVKSSWMSRILRTVRHWAVQSKGAGQFHLCQGDRGGGSGRGTYFLLPQMGVRREVGGEAGDGGCGVFGEGPRSLPLFTQQVPSGEGFKSLSSPQSPKLPVC